jgi:thiol-disulfide isomerase/thioredoxin
VAVLVTAAAAATQPDLSFRDAEGRKVHLRDLRGKVVVLNFWATWCGPCAREMPLLVEMEKQYRKRGVVFAAVSLDDSRTRRQVPDFISRHGVVFPVWYGATAEDLERLALGQAIPATAFFDADGRVAARVLGEIRPDEIRARLEWLTSDHTAPRPELLVKHLEEK